MTFFIIFLTLLLTHSQKPETCPKLPPNYTLVYNGETYSVAVSEGVYVDYNDRRGRYGCNTFEYLMLRDSCAAKRAAWKYFLQSN